MSTAIFAIRECEWANIAVPAYDEALAERNTNRCNDVD